jgi:hypothetical protein
LDRLIVTRANQKDAAGNVVNKDKVITGFGALVIRHKIPDGYRFAAAGGGTLVLGAATYAVHRYTRSDIGTAILGGLAFGFGLKLASLGVAFVLPKILPVKDSTADTWQNQLFPEHYFDQDTAKTTQAMQGGTFGGPRRFAGGAVSRQDFGPTAGSTGCGCSRCSEERERLSGGCPKAPGPQGQGQPERRQPAVDTETEEVSPTHPVGETVNVMPENPAAGLPVPRLRPVEGGRRLLIVPRRTAGSGSSSMYVK